MTLKERVTEHHKIKAMFDDSTKYAEQFAIDFADWKDENCFQATGIALWLIPESNEFTSAYTNEQLLEIYKKEKGL